MSSVSYRSSIEASQHELFAWHDRPGALERLLPPWQAVRVLEQHGGIKDGGTVVLSVPVGPLRRRWVARHCGYEPPRQFQDEQVAGPFARWIHTHQCLPAEEGVKGGEGRPADRSQLLDHVEYDPPLGPAGRWLGGRTVRRQLDRMFLFRHQRTAEDLRRHGRFRGRPPLRVVLSGASGLVGQALKPFLTTGGHQVLTLVRRQANPQVGEISWDPAAGTLDAAALEAVDAVVHLSGENIAAGRWTAERKRRFASSRVGSTRLLSEALAGLKRPPRVLVSASAVGIYGNRGEQTLTESSPAGAGFLADLCRDWEAAAAPAARAGVRVVHPRIGAVIAARGGALGKMLRPFQLGLGGVIGSGRQYMSWISLDDLLGVIHEALFNPEITGPVNAVAPEPVTNRQFVKTLGGVLHRPTVLPLPAAAVNLLFGEMGRTVLLEGARVVPAKLQSAGFEFRHPTLESALRAELGRQAAPPGWGNESTARIPGTTP